MNSALVPLDDKFHELIQGLTECREVQAQVGLATELLYTLGIAVTENVPPLAKGQSLTEYVEHLTPENLAMVEALGIGQGRQLEEVLKKGARRILYDQYVTGRWRYYAQEIDTDQWSPYVTHVLDDVLHMSDGEGRRWAVAIEVISQLYVNGSKDRFGLEFRGDTVVIDNDTGEIGELKEGLPPTAEETVLEQFSRFAREAGVRLRDLLRELDGLPLVYWDKLVNYQEAGLLDDEQLAAKEGWTLDYFASLRRLYKTVSEVRRILKLASSPTLTDKQVNREATGGKVNLPMWVPGTGQPPPPELVAFIAHQYPDVISLTESLPIGKRYVQIRLTEWPRCSCGEAMYIGLRRLRCACGNTRAKDAVTEWAWRAGDEYGHYPSGWTIDGTPVQKKWTNGNSPETMEIHGLTISLWEVVVDLEELD